jgi:two-component system, LytTR family, sensor kinase
MQTSNQFVQSDSRLTEEFDSARFWRELRFSVVWWSGAVVAESTLVLLNDSARGYVLPLSHYFLWAAFNWYSWALLTPVVLYLGRRYPLTRENRMERIWFPHLIACLACVLLQALLRGVAGAIYTGFYEQRATVATLTGEALERLGTLSFLAYWMIVAIAAFLHLREEIRMREVRQAQLEGRLASAELEMLRIQIQPHFLFNTLQAAITLVQEDPRAAEDVLLRLSQLLRVSLDDMGGNEISLAKELEFLDLYVGIQRVRFGDRLTVAIHADAATLNRQVPPLLLQPLVENAIRHGIGKHKGEDTIDIYARVANGSLEMEVWNQNSVVEESTEVLLLRGVGLRNTKARLEQLYGRDASLILRGLGKRGAVALISVPLRREAAR